jgi:putative phosphoribosyl transferase
MTQKPHRREPVRFRDRRDAGKQLVALLDKYRTKPATVVLGLPRGGVVPAAEIALALDLPLDVLISRKLHAPDNPEFAIGAIAEGGEPYLNDESVALTGATPEHVAAEIREQRAETAHRQARFRGGRELTLPERPTVILVDDGVATGATVIAAIRTLRQRAIERLVLAIPVAPPETAAALKRMVDELVVLATPDPFWAVGAFYDDFPQVSDDAVGALLADVAARQQRQHAEPAGAAAHAR